MINVMSKLSIEYNCICLIDIVNYSSWCVGKSALQVRDFLKSFLDRVEKILPGDVIIVEASGDELFLISTGVDSMVRAVFSIIDLEIPVRIGIHYGAICKDNDRYFGGDINITSRLQTSSFPGNIIHMSKKAFERTSFSSREFIVGKIQENNFKGVGKQHSLFVWKKQPKIELFGQPDDIVKLKGNVYSFVEIIPFDIDQCLDILKELREFEMYHRNNFQKIYTNNKVLYPLCSTCTDHDSQRYEYNLLIRRRRRSFDL